MSLKKNSYTLIIFAFVASCMGCSGDGLPSWVESARQDIETSINHDISGCKTKVYQKENSWFVLCYAGDTPAGGGALFEVFEYHDSNSEYDYYIIPISGVAKQYAEMPEFKIIHIPVREMSMDYAAAIIDRYFKTFD
ncbi:hypothetical protein ACEF96_004371 [Salmonella enterica]|nr:hypothetical protein [Salmonella enterica]